LGIGAVWTAAYPLKERMAHIEETLQLPKHIKPLCIISLGYPLAENSPKDKFDATRIRYDKW